MLLARSFRVICCLTVSVLAMGCPRQHAGDADSGTLHDATAAPASAASAPVPAATDVMSNASASWDGGPAVLAAGSVDGNALRAKNRARIAADRSPVTMLQRGTPLELGERICQAAVPKVPTETPILVKPNIGGFEWFKDPKTNSGDDGLKGRITDPEFVRGIIHCLKARGHTKITITEGWGAKHKDWEHLVEASGYAAMTKEEHVPLVAMDDDGVFDVEGDEPGKPLTVTGMEKTHAPTLLMAKILAEHLQHGLFISAPKIKAHRFGVTSMAIKGGQGVVMLSDASPAFNQKWRMHKELGAALALLPKDKEAGQKAYLDALEIFAERMSDVLEVAAPHVTLAEGAPAEGGDGFGKRWPTTESVAIGGTNPILVDRVGAQFLGLWDNAELARELGGHKTSPLIETAARRFGVDIANPAVEGDGAPLLASPRPVNFVSMSGFQLHTDGAAPRETPSASETESENEDAGKPTLHAKHVATPITIDGVADAAWDAAPAVTFATDWRGEPATPSTSVKALWSKDAFYMLWNLTGAGVNSDPSYALDVDRPKLYEEDCVEVFFTPAAAVRTRYYEIEVGPLGHFFDIAVDKKTNKSDTSWSSAPEIKTVVDRSKHHVTIEMALRSPDILRALKAGAVLPFALYRLEGKSPRQYLAWSPTRTDKPNFHVPDAFGSIAFE